MAPIVHGLESEWKDRVDFVYLDVADSATQALKERLGFRSTPHFFMLAADGRVMSSLQGVVPRDSLVVALEGLVAPAPP